MVKKLDFIKPATLRVLETFFEHPLEKLHEREVMRKSGVSKGSVNKILRQLAGLGFLMREEKGRMVFYELELRSPIVRQFKVLYNIWQLSDFLENAKQNAAKIILFGSCSDGTDAKESDIDILIITKYKAAARENVSSFNRKSEKRISPIIVDNGEFAAMRKQEEPLYERIGRGIVLWEMEREI
jgi:predicted nucleotidyltransferase